MQEQRTPALEEERTDQTILGLLIAPEHQRPWSQRELELEVGEIIEVEDSLARLRAAGLLHRCGEFAWASRAALHAQRLVA